MKEYKHTVKYYETDKMGITHHSNYIRWMEEARVDFFKKIGFSYVELEDEGIISPVVGVKCQYKLPTKFDEEISIKVIVKEFRGVKLYFEYEMKKEETGEIVCVGETKHCFVNVQNKPIILKKAYPKLDEKLKELASM